MVSISSKSEAKKSYVAFFDLDDTLLSVNSGKILFGEANRNGLISRGNLLYGLYLTVLYKLKLAHSTKIIEKMAFWLKGMEEKKVIELSDSVLDRFLINEINKAMLHELETHRRQNAQLVLLSAALPYICLPIAKNLRMDDVICSSLQLEDGIFTGLPDGQLVFGSEKGKRLKAYCDLHGLDLEQAYCYADSFSDMPALEAVGNSVCVRPDRRLTNMARKHGWRIIND